MSTETKTIALALKLLDLPRVDLVGYNFSEKEIDILTNLLAVNQAIKYLNLSDNCMDGKKISILATALKTNRSLTTLLLNNNDIGWQGAFALEATIPHSSITILSLSNTGLMEEIIGGKPEEKYENEDESDLNIQPIARLLENGICRLTQLCLSNNQLNNKDLKRIASALRTNHHLTYLDLSRNHIKDTGVKDLVAELIYNTTLTILNLSYNNITENGIQPLIKLLHTNHTLLNIKLLGNKHRFAESCEILKIHLKNNLLLSQLHDPAYFNAHQYSSTPIKSIVKMLADVLRVNTTIIYLNLSNIGLGINHMPLLMNGLKNNRTIIHLNLAHNNISGLAFLSPPTIKIIGKHQTLRHINLTNCQLIDEDIETIANILTYNTVLTSIHFSDNHRLGERSVQALIRLSKTNYTLTEIQFSPNYRMHPALIDTFEKCLAHNKHVVALIEALETNPHLTHLEINDHGLSRSPNDTVIRLVTEALKTKYPFPVLKLTSHDIKPAEISMILKRYSCHITHISLGDNILRDKNIQEVVNALMHTNRSVTHIKLSGKNIGTIIKALTYNLHMTSLDISESILEEEDIRILLTLLEINDKLTDIKLPSHKNICPSSPEKYRRSRCNQLLRKSLKVYRQKRRQPQYMLQEQKEEYYPFTVSEKMLQKFYKLNSMLIQLENGSLTTFSLDQPIEEQTIQIFLNILRVSTTLTHLSLKYQYTSEAYSVAIIEALQTNQSVTHFCIAGNDIDLAESKAIADLLSLNRTLKELNLSNNNLGDLNKDYRCGSMILEALKNNQTLTFLDFSGNSFKSPLLCFSFAEILKTNKTLTTLRLSSNDISFSDFEWVIMEAISINSALTHLDFSYNNLRDYRSAEQMAYIFQINRHLTHINISNNALTSRGLKEIAIALRSNYTLTSLKISDNELRDEGIRVIAEILQTNNTLTEIDLSYTIIETDGAKALADALHVNHGLRKIDLSGNYITSTSTEAIAAALIYNKTLTDINLFDNHIGDVGAQAIAAMLAHNQTLTGINLSDNHIGRKGALAILKALQTNGTITEINLYENEDIPPVLIAAIEAQLAKNKFNTLRETMPNKEHDYLRYRLGIFYRRTPEIQQEPLPLAAHPAAAWP